MIDAQPKGCTYEGLEALLRQRPADVVGITAMTFTLIDVFKTARIIRRVMPEAKIVLGGPHVHLFPDETVRRPEVDFLILGEGEVAFLQLLNNLDHPTAWPHLKGLVYQDQTGRIVNNGIAAGTENLDELGIPARHLLDVGDYTSLLGRDNVITTMFTRAGAPIAARSAIGLTHRCSVDSRCRSAAHVADEMELCLALGITEAFIYDDTFTVRRDRVLELCDEIERRGIKFRWDAPT